MSDLSVVKEEDNLKLSQDNFNLKSAISANKDTNLSSPIVEKNTSTSLPK
jgi:hypothetical protein